PVGIVRQSHAELQVGLTYYFEILALVSMSLALLNLLPLLPLDGGHILFSLIEGLRGRALAREVYERVSVAGIALILLVFVIAFSTEVSGAAPHGAAGSASTEAEDFARSRRARLILRMASERQISVGGVKIGGGAPVVVQSMTTTKTHDVEATTAQVAALASA